MAIVIRKTGNLLDISMDGDAALPDVLRRQIEPLLSYQKKTFNYGFNRTDPMTGKRLNKMETHEKRCFKYDAFGRLVTNFGFVYRIAEALKGQQVEFRESAVEMPRPNAYKFNWQALETRFGYRALQKPCMSAIAAKPCGIIHAVTGFGKMVMLTMTCLGFDQAVISVITKRATLVNKIHAELSKYIPNVGQIGGAQGSKNYMGDRITVYTCASAHKADFNSDLLLVDEGHEAMADSYAAELARFHRSRNFTFTASPRGRIDGTDIRLEAMFGKTIFALPYQMAVDHDLVVPMQVELIDVCMDTNPCAGKADTAKKRHGLWRNEERNKKFAWKVNQFGSDEQILILVETIEHAVYLRQLLPDYTLVYDKLELAKKSWYQAHDMLPEDEPEMTPARKEQLRVEFESGALRKVIATKMWSTGIDAPGLTAVVRADAGDSEIMDIQASGRATRIDKKTGKAIGRVIDARDQFDETFARKAKSRISRYRKNGWKIFLTQSDGSLEPLR